MVKSLDRLSRNKADIRNELQFFKDQGIRLKVIDLPTTMMELLEGQSWVFEMVNNILIEVMGTIAEQERLTIKQRQAEGIAAAKAKGKKFGRPVIKKFFSPISVETLSQRQHNIESSRQFSRKFFSKSCLLFFIPAPVVLD